MGLKIMGCQKWAVKNAFVGSFRVELSNQREKRSPPFEVTKVTRLGIRAATGG